MEARHARALNTLLYCQRFLDEHASFVGTINQSGTGRLLDAMILQAENSASAQAGSKRLRTGHAASLAAAKRKLRGVMRPVAEVAKSHLRDVPEFLALFMPRVSIKTEEVVAAAGAMVSAASPYADTFIQSGLAPDFLADITAHAAMVTEWAARREQADVERTGATAGLRDAIRRGRRAVAVIDALLEPMLEDNESLLATWKSAKRVPAKKGPAAGLKHMPAAIPAHIVSSVIASTLIAS